MVERSAIIKTGGKGKTNLEVGMHHMSAYLYGEFQIPRNGQEVVIGRIGDAPVQLARRKEQVEMQTNFARVVLCAGTVTEVTNQFQALARAVSKSPDPLRLVRDK